MKTTLQFFLKFLFLAIALNVSFAQESSTILFQSSFDGVTIDKSTDKHILTGTDTQTGFVWPSQLPGNWFDNYFNYVIEEYDDYQDFVETEIETVTGMDGNPTEALYIEYKQDDEDFVSTSRVQYVFLGDENSTERVQRMNQGYVRCKMKIHLEKDPDDKDYFLPIEWKDTGDDGFRMGFYVYDSNEGGDNPYYVVKGQYMDDGSLGDDVWEVESDEPVIEDEWFEIEYYWYASSDDEKGKLQIAINGEILFDVTDQTKDEDHEDRMYYFMPFKVYGTKSNSYITDFEYRNIAPPNSPLYNGALSTDDIEFPSKLELYPIPTNKMLNFSKDFINFNYQIITVTGKIVDKGIVKTESVNVSALTKGVYFIKFKNKTLNVERFAKFVKN